MNIENMLRLHRDWLDRKDGGVRADFSGADFKGVNFEGVSLVSANLSEANFEGANLSGANLEGAYLVNANFEGANLKGANLACANLINAYLKDADFSGAYLESAYFGETYAINTDFSNANLGDACFKCANLKKAIFENANLRGADFKDATLYCANFSGATLPAYMICPEKGSFIAYKALRGQVIAVLEIPAEARRTSSLVGRKCRAEFVRVVELLNCTREYGVSFYAENLVYRVGELVYPDAYDDDIRLECAPGIHFFMTQQEAKNYA